MTGGKLGIGLSGPKPVGPSCPASFFIACRRKGSLFFCILKYEADLGWSTYLSKLQMWLNNEVHERVNVNESVMFILTYIYN